MTPEQQKLLEQLAALDNQGDAAKAPTKAKLIIKAFAEMNIAALEILLDDAKTYHNATKKVFYRSYSKIGILNIRYIFYSLNRFRPN